MSIESTKRCAKCKAYKPNSELYKIGIKKRGVRSYCKPCFDHIQVMSATNSPQAAISRRLCASRSKAKMRGHTPCLTNPENILESWDGVCTCCGKTIRLAYERSHEAGTSKALSACLDHDHVTGQFRGFLCLACNLCVGHANDSPDLLRKCADYLEACKAKHDPAVLGEVEASCPSTPNEE